MDDKIKLQLEIIDAQLDLVNSKLGNIESALKLLASCAVFAVSGKEDAIRVLDIGKKEEE